MKFTESIREKSMAEKTRIPFGTISITERSKELIQKILDSTRITNGKYVRKFEERFADLVGTKEAIAVSSGTDAVALALATLYDFGASRDDEIIVPALSFVATGNAVLQAGFEPVFVDVERETLNIDPHLIEREVTEKTQAILPVHFMGKPAEMDAINKIAKKYDLFVIEDAAEAHGAMYKGNSVGTLGDMAAFSLYLAHIITTVEGGIVTTDNSQFGRVLRSLRAHGRACDCKVCVLNTSSGSCPKRFEHDTDIRFVFERIGFSCKMNELEVAVGLGNLDVHQKILAKRRCNLTYMRNEFKKFSSYFKTVDEEPHEIIGPHAFPIILREDVDFTRDEFVNFLKENGIDTRNLFSSMPTQCSGFSFLGYELGEFPNAEYIGNSGLHVGVHQDIEKEQIDYFIDVVEKFL